MTTSYAVLLDRSAVPQTHSEVWRRRLEAEALTPIFTRGIIQVCVRRDQPFILLPDDGGIVIGTIFHRNDTRRATAHSLGRLPASGDRTRWFIENLWGRYIAVFTDAHGQQVDILRDPTGLMACYSAERDGIRAFAADARLFRQLGIITGTVDWTQLAMPLALPDFRGTTTALVGVSEPAPGGVTSLDPEGERIVTLWSPGRYCRRSTPADFDTSSDELLHEVDRCVSAWTNGASAVLLSLSGGLDSSVLAASIPDASQRLFAFNLRSGPGRGDERDHARAIAAHIGFPLEEIDVTVPEVDLRRSLAADQPRPSARAFTQPADRVAANLADRVGANLHVNGGGGDNVFAFLHSANPAADRLRVEGMGRGFFRTVLDLAEITHCTPVHVGRRAIRKAWFGPRQFQWPRTLSLLSAAYVAGLNAPSHPWLDGLEDLLPGQREHVASILRAINFVEYLNIEDVRPTIYPLLSQPLVETCLAIPSWLCCRGGRDRAVARAAFAHRIPDTILARRTKGSFDAMSARIFQTHLPVIREMILDGGLMRHGILSLEDVRPVLDERIVTGSAYGRILQCVDLEAWASAWN